MIVYNARGENPVLKRLWNDPVWSKVIAGLILAALTAIAGLSWQPLGIWLLGATPTPNWILFMMCLVLVCETTILLAIARRRAPNPPAVPIHVVPIGDTDVVEDKTPGRGYPLKAYRTMRNDSIQPVDVRVADYRVGTVDLKKFVTDVLQVKLREWFPDKGDGLERVAVLPGQQFKAWVGADEKKYTKDQLDRLRGRIGTLVLMVNGERVDIPL